VAQRTFITENPCYAVGFGPNIAVLRGKQWLTSPLLPSPRDTTTQADAYRAQNAETTRLVNVWPAVRYGVAPVGDLRFKAAVGYDYPAGLHVVGDVPPPPYQTYDKENASDGRPEFGMPDIGEADWVGMGTRESEDCLFYSVFAPATGTGHPIVFMIPGGGWAVNHAWAQQTYGHRLAAEWGCIVIVLNYRRGVLGHFPHPSVAVEGEPSVAYTDIKLGVEKGRAFAATIGGDVSKCLIMGTSAGGAAVQLMLEDDDVQGLFSSAWVDSGGGTGLYWGALKDAAGPGYIYRMKQFEAAIRGTANMLFPMPCDYTTIEQALASETFAWVLQNAMRVTDLQALSEVRPYLTNALAAWNGTGDLVLADGVTGPDNVYPLKRVEYASAIEAAKAGKVRKPTVFGFAECEALNLLGSNYTTLRDALLALPTATLNGWARRLGYADYTAWKGSAWIATYAGGDLGNAASAQFRTVIDPLADDCENRRVLYTHSIFAYAAWRAAYAASETGSAAAWVLCNNLSPNSIWAGHSNLISIAFGNVEWVVGGVVGEGADADANLHMKSLYAASIMMEKVAKMAATGNPDGAYTYEGMSDFSGDAQPAPARAGEAYGGATTGTMTPYNHAAPTLVNVLGKFFPPDLTLNGGGFTSGLLDLDLQRDAKLHSGVDYMGAAFTEYLSLLEP
jgi:hypothetical protein